MLTGCHELIQQAMSLLPSSTGLDTMNLQGHSALMLAAINNDPGTIMVSSIIPLSGQMLDILPSAQTQITRILKLLLFFP